MKREESWQRVSRTSASSCAWIRWKASARSRRGRKPEAAEKAVAEAFLSEECIECFGADTLVRALTSSASMFIICE